MRSETAKKILKEIPQEIKDRVREETDEYIKKMKHAIIKNVPKNPNKLFKEAIFKSFNWWIDEKGTKDNPDIWRRKNSNLSYDEAFKIIQANKPHWVISFRNHSALFEEEDYWEFGGCNIASNDYGQVFIWIQVKVEEAEELFKKYKLEGHEY